MSEPNNNTFAYIAMADEAFSHEIKSRLNQNRKEIEKHLGQFNIHHICVFYWQQFFFFYFEGREDAIEDLKKGDFFNRYLYLPLQDLSWEKAERVFFDVPPRDEIPVKQKFGQVIRVKPDKLAYYKELHANPWPGVIKAIEQANLQNYSIFLYKDQYLFGYMEYTGDDLQHDMESIAADPVTQAWWKETDPCQESLSDDPGQWWVDMELIKLLG